MIQRCGIILLDKTEITIRIYETDHSEWRLLQYQNTQLKSSEDAASIIESLTDLLADEGTAVSEWKIAARALPSSIIQVISAAIGIAIETISPLREQELLCKGLFTELW